MTPLFINRNSFLSTKFYYFCCLCNFEFTIKLKYNMGKGDKKSKRGKIIRGSFGVRRKRKANKSVIESRPKGAVKEVEKPVTAAAETKTAKPVRTAKPKAPAKTAAKPAAKKTEKEPGAVAEKAAKPATKAKKPAAKKEKEE